MSLCVLLSVWREAHLTRFTSKILFSGKIPADEVTVPEICPTSLINGLSSWPPSLIWLMCEDKLFFVPQNSKKRKRWRCFITWWLRSRVVSRINCANKQTWTKEAVLVNKSFTIICKCLRNLFPFRVLDFQLYNHVIMWYSQFWNRTVNDRLWHVSIKVGSSESSYKLLKTSAAVIIARLVMLCF